MRELSNSEVLFLINSFNNLYYKILLFVLIKRSPCYWINQNNKLNGLKSKRFPQPLAFKSLKNPKSAHPDSIIGSNDSYNE